MVPRLWMKACLPEVASKANRLAPLSIWYSRSPSRTGDEKPPWNPVIDHLTFSFFRAPVADASTPARSPISLDSRFSSLWLTIAMLPESSGPVLRPRLLTT